MELPPLTVGTVLNHEQAQFALRKTALPLGTCVKFVSSQSSNLHTCPLGVIVSGENDLIHKTKIKMDIPHITTRTQAPSVKAIEIYPRLSPEDYKRITGQERGD